MDNMLYDVDVDEDGPFIVKYKEDKMLYPPINEIEEKILLLFKLREYDTIFIEFKSSEDYRYIKYKYWEDIDIDDIVYIQENANVQLKRFEWDDEDTGMNVSFHIIPNTDEEE